MSRPLKVGAALLAAILVFGLVFGVGQAAADSLPGTPLYGLKVAAEEARLALTSKPQASADLNAALAEKRLDEVAQMLQKGKKIDDETAQRAQRQVHAAVDTALQLQNQAATQALQQLGTALQQRQQAMVGAGGEPPEAPVQQLMREMERIRQELHTGAGDPEGLRQRWRYGEPSDGTEPPGPQQTPGPHATDHPGPGPGEPQATNEPGSGPGPGPQPTEKPAGPDPNDQPGPGPGAQPTDKPGGPNPTTTPGSGPGPGSGPTNNPGQGGGGGSGGGNQKP